MPFCARRCDYCAFATWTDRGHLMERYVAAVGQELRRAYALEGLGPAATVFVGGGTPSLLPAEQLASLLRQVERLPGAEVTVECNPESTSRALLEALAEAGVTRISLGVQSLSPRVLAGLGREHHPGAVERAVAAVGAVGFASFNVDLIYGGAGEQDSDWRSSLEGVLALEPSPPHLSAYALTVEAGTPLQRDRSRHPDEDVQARRYELADELLEAGGRSWYELSNWARPGHECRHNLSCWNQGDYRGVGCAAHSHAQGVRSWNIFSLERYLAAVESGRSPVAGREELTPEARSLEALELSLRTRRGVPTEALEPGWVGVALDAGLLEPAGGRLVLTRRGRLLANEVAMHLRPGIPPSARAAS